MQTWLHRFDFPPKTMLHNESKVGTRGDENSPILPAESNLPPLRTIEWLREGSNLTAAKVAVSRLLLHRQLSPTQDDLSAAALMHRLYPDALLFHSLFWPLAIILCGLLLIGLAYAIDGCKVWSTDMTVIA